MVLLIAAAPAFAAASTSDLHLRARLLLREIREQSSAPTKDTARLRAELSALKAENSAAPDDKVSAHLTEAEADLALVDAGADLPPPSSDEAVPDPDLRDAVAQPAAPPHAPVLQNATPAALPESGGRVFDGAVLQRSLTVTSVGVPPQAPAANLDEYLALDDYGEQMDFLTTASAGLLDKLKQPDKSGARAQFLAEKLDYAMENHPERANFISVHVRVPDDGMIHLIYRVKDGGAVDEILGPLDVWSTPVGHGKGGGGGGKKKKKRKSKSGGGGGDDGDSSSNSGKKSHGGHKGHGGGGGGGGDGGGDDDGGGGGGAGRRQRRFSSREGSARSRAAEACSTAATTRAGTRWPVPPARIMAAMGIRGTPPAPRAANRVAARGLGTRAGTRAATRAATTARAPSVPAALTPARANRFRATTTATPPGKLAARPSLCRRISGRTAAVRRWKRRAGAAAAEAKAKGRFLRTRRHGSARSQELRSAEAPPPAVTGRAAQGPAALAQNPPPVATAPSPAEVAPGASALNAPFTADEDLHDAVAAHSAVSPAPAVSRVVPASAPAPASPASAPRPADWPLAAACAAAIGIGAYALLKSRQA